MSDEITRNCTHVVWGEDVVTDFNTSGSIGYAHKSYINITSTNYGTVKTTGGTMNFRASASTSSALLGTIPNGTVLPIISTSNGWHKVVWGKTVGYVSGSYFIANGSTSSGSNSSNSSSSGSTRTTAVRQEIVD